MRDRKFAPRRIAVAVGLALALAGVSGCNPAEVAEAVNDALADCTTAGQVQSVRTTLRDIYYWYKELPDPDPATFTSPEAYLEAVRFKTLDHTYSFITGRAESDAFFSDSQFIGFGFRTALGLQRRLARDRGLSGQPGRGGGRGRAGAHPRRQRAPAGQPRLARATSTRSSAPRRSGTAARCRSVTSRGRCARSR